jgi:signal transduction histidine kinase
MYTAPAMQDEAYSPPLPRLPAAETLRQMSEALPLASGPLSLDASAGPAAVLNAQRQVVWANRAFLELTGDDRLEDLCGRRTGELFHCVSARPSCGEGPGCPFCGAAQAITETLRTGKPAARECSIAAAGAARGPALDFLVRTQPFQIGGTPFTLVGFTDIADQKRRQSLERLFFHDILNTTSGFRVYLDILGREKLGESSRRLVDRLASICSTLEEEIKGQKVMLGAESGTLKVQRNLIESTSLAEQLTGHWEGLEMARGRKIALAPFLESVTFISDDTLVKRILSNMAKNALEASPEGAVVTLGITAEQGERVRFAVHNPAVMDPATRQHVFRRYFSTKGNDRGLGTWGMRLLAEDYLGGSVRFTSAAPEGTTFVLTLPLRPAGW